MDSDSTTQVILTEKVRMVVFLPVTAAEFDGKKQQTFKEAIAKTAGPTVRADHVIIDAIEERTAARRLLNQGIRIDVRVNAVDKSVAASIAARLTQDSINAGLTSVGLPPATLLEAAAVVTTVNGNQTAAALEEEATLFLGPVWTVAGTFAASIVFAGLTFWIVKQKSDITYKKARALWLLDVLDTLCDWASWTGTSLEGDFAFSNDRGGIVKWTLFAISVFGTVLFIISTTLMRRYDARYKYILILQLGFENFAQGILYIIVASSQASTANVRIAVFVGIVQALCFCAFQIYELNSLPVNDGGTGGNHGGGSGGNPGAGRATPPPASATTATGRGGVGGGGAGFGAHGTSPAAPSSPLPPHAPASSGGGQPAVFSMSPTDPNVSSSLIFGEFGGSDFGGGQSSNGGFGGGGFAGGQLTNGGVNGGFGL
jgi:hypothetical protein